MDTTIRSRRLILGAAVALAPVLLAVGNSLFPPGSFHYAGTTGEAHQALAATAAAPGRVLAASLTSLVGFVLLGIAFGSIAGLVRHRGGAAATAGAVVGGIGSVGAVLVVCWLGLSVYADTRAPISTDAQAAYLVSLLKGSGLGNVAGFAFLPGLALGSILLAVGLFRSRRVPGWLSFLLAPAVLLATVAAPQGPVGGLLTLPLVATMALLAREVARDEPAGSAATGPDAPAVAATGARSGVR